MAATRGVMRWVLRWWDVKFFIISGSTALLSGEGALSGVSTILPWERICTVGNEAREYMPVSENRSYSVPSEDRTKEV